MEHDARERVWAAVELPVRREIDGDAPIVDDGRRDPVESIASRVLIALPQRR